MPPKKGSEAYQVQDNFCVDWQLINAVIDLLNAKNVGFHNGCELTAGKQLVVALADFSHRATEVIARLGSSSAPAVL